MFKPIIPFQYVRERGNVIRYPFSMEPYECTRSIKIIDYPNVKENYYTIDSEGIICNIYTHKELKQAMSDNGYMRATLADNNTGKNTHLIHRLVAYHFCNPPTDYEKYIVNHIDGNRTNNDSRNLEWITTAANVQHGLQRLCCEHGISIYDNRPIIDAQFVHYVCKQFELGKSNTEILRECNIPTTNANHCMISDIRAGRSWQNIVNQYSFNKKSRNYVFTVDEKEQIKEYIQSGMDVHSIYAAITGETYHPCKEATRKINAIYTVKGSMFNKF